MEILSSIQISTSTTFSIKVREIVSSDLTEEESFGLALELTHQVATHMAERGLTSYTPSITLKRVALRPITTGALVASTTLDLDFEVTFTRRGA